VIPPLAVVPSTGQKGEDTNLVKLDTKKNNVKKPEPVKKPTASVPQITGLKVLPSSSSTSPKKKSGARTDRTDKEKDKKPSPLYESTLTKEKEIKDKDKESSKVSNDKKKTNKKQHDRKKRASASIASLIKETGRVDFDPKGLFSKDKKKVKFC